MPDTTRKLGAAMTVCKAADRGLMGPSTLRQKLKAGIGPKAFKRPGSNRYMIFEADFDDWLLSRPVGSGVAAPKTPGEEDLI